jgi:TonB family C-terminal domain
MTKNSSSIFSPSGCISEDGLTRYLQGEMNEQEQALVREHLAGCELCKAAITGLAPHATDVNFDAELRKVRQKLSHLRPLDFLAESRGGGFRLMVRSISVALAIVVIVALLFVGARYVFVKKGSRDMTVTNGITALQTKPERRYISSKELDKSVAKGSATRPVFFNNGQSFEDYIQSKLVYPAELSKKPIPGKVVVRFTIGSDGVVREVFIVRSTNPAFSREAHKLLYASPKWQPAEVGGVKVATLMMIELNWKK